MFPEDGLAPGCFWVAPAASPERGTGRAESLHDVCDSSLELCSPLQPSDGAAAAAVEENEPQDNERLKVGV